MENRDNQDGFTLLELLVVLTVLLIISAIAIPNFLHSRMAANEASAVGSLRTVIAACANYSSTWGTGFPVSLSYLGPGKPAIATAADLVDSSVSDGAKSGYQFTYVSGAPTNGKISTYTITASPVVPGKSGGRYFFTDQSGVIRYDTAGAATVTSPPIS
jgi:prepilin-type N-terminal cleavage/methylation domain-containing protein